MKSILQIFALMSAMILIASCGGGSGGGEVFATPPIEIPLPIDTAAGAAVKGVIDGAVVTVTDADGDTIGTGTTTAGAYSVTYTPEAVSAGVTNPITVTIDGTGATTVCDFVNPDNSGNDCETNTADTFVAFGATYSLPDGFTLVCIVPTANISIRPTSACNVSPGSDLAATEAGVGGTVTTATALEANLAISGLIQSITGINLGGVPINEIPIPDITGTGGSTATAAQLAVAAFASSIVAAQGAGESLAEVIARFATSISIDANGNVVATGDDLAVIANALADSLQTVADAVNNPEINNAVDTAARSAATFTALCAGTAPGETCSVTATLPTGGGGDDVVSLTVTFVGTLSSAISGVLATTGAEGTGADISLTEAFVNELDAVRLLSEDNATKAFDNLDTALNDDAAAIDAGTKISPVTNDATTEDGLEYVLTKDGDGAFTVTGVVSQWPKITANLTEEDVQVVITGATASSTATGFSVPAARLVLIQNSVTLQTFDGSLVVVEGTAADTFDSIAFTGTILGGTDGTSFSVDATFTDVDDSTTGNPDGSYTATIGFISPAADDLTVTFTGELGGAVQAFTITTGSTAVAGLGTRTSEEGAEITTDVVTFTDGTVVLTLTEVTDGRVIADSNGNIGSFTVGTGTLAVTTATLNSDGLVTYSDGSIQSLPAVIFN